MIKDAIEKLRKDLVDLPGSLPQLAKAHNLPLSALYRFSNGKDVKLITLYKIEAMVMQEHLKT